MQNVLLFIWRKMVKSIPFYLIEKAWQYKKEVFLPVLPPTGHSLLFAPFTKDTPLAPNRFNIDEPQTHPHIGYVHDS